MVKEAEGMHRLRVCAAVVALSAALGAPAAHADVVTLNDLESQTVDGQDFTFTFAGLAPSDGTGATFILHARGDYEGALTETLSWTIDGGVVSAGPVGGFASPCQVGLGGPFDFCTQFQPLGNVEWQRTYAITPAITNALLADGTLSIFVDLSSDVNVGDGIAMPNFVEVTFRYNSLVGPPTVPEPAPWVLLPVALAAIIVSRRSRVRRA